MAQIPYADSNGRLSVEVEISHTSDVFLVDSINYNRYKSGSNFEYFGGNYNRSPVHISVSGSGRWYLIVRGCRQYKYRFY